MNQSILAYIKTQRVGVLAVEMLDGSPHAATVHFAHTEDPLVFYFETYQEYRKAEALLGRDKSRASFVIGSDESNMKTVQIDGTIELLKPEEMGMYDKIYFAKFPNKLEKYHEKKFLCFKLLPTWWRFTDWTNPQGKIVLTSEFC